MQLNELSACEIIKNNIAPLEVCQDLAQKVSELDGKIGAYIWFEPDSAIEAAKKNQNNKRRLEGIPVAIKDNICVKGEPTTCASKILKGFRPPYNATVIEKLKAEGAILLGKTNMDEFAFGSSTENSAIKKTRNPWDLQRVPGGSSGGSAAAVAADEAIMALGSDTGGSIRQPASLCGVVGLKPTYGRVSRYGLIAFASSLDQIGPITKNVSDAALLLSVISGYDEKDSTSANMEVPDYTKSLINDVKGLKIGIPKEYFIKGIDPQVESHIKDAIELYKRLGATTVELSLPHTEYATAVYYIVAPSEASSNLARFDGVQYGIRAEDAKGLVDMYETTRSMGFGDEAKRRIMLGTYALSSGYYEAYYLRALKVRTLIKKDFDQAFKNCDIILTPTSPTVAFKIGEKFTDPLSMYLSDIFTISANLAGIPGISIPCGFTKEFLPVGLQLLGKPFDEVTLLRAAYTFERNTDYCRHKPPCNTKQ
ncbi:MAG: Asp-tRNA(Asn)/Glu-tRNA(Gln) amidotransferase subunit GatA [Candidatus Omnitrophota bacterium]